MPKHVTIENLRHHVGEEITLRGWLYNQRGSGKLVFLEIRDGTGVVQAVVFLFAAIFVLVNLAVDLLYAVLDPRISYR